MKVFESKIFDLINNILNICQSKFDNIRKNSFLLLNIDWIILFFIMLVYISSTFMGNGIIAIFAFWVILLVILKVLITKGEKIELESCNFYLIVYLLICLISNFTSTMPKESFYGFSKTLLYIAFYFALCQFLKNNKRFIKPILFFIALLIAVESVIGLWQNYIRVENISTWQDKSYLNPEDILTRVYGTLKPYNPNLFGGWLMSGVSTLIGISAICIYKKRLISSIISLLGLLISILCIFYTGCRGAYIALFSIILSILIVLFKLNKTGKIISIILAIFGSIFIIIHKSIFKRLLSIFIMRNDSSTSFRMNVYNSAIEMFKDNPICGIGAGNKVFREIYGLYMLSGFDALSCYCVFLEIAVESGIFALTAFLLFLCSLLFNGLKVLILSKDKIEKIILFTAIISIIAIMVHGLVDTVYFRPQIQFIFWTMSAILITKQRNYSITAMH